MTTVRIERANGLNKTVTLSGKVEVLERALGGLVGVTKKKRGRKPKKWFYHVIANELRAGVPGYVVKQTYQLEWAMRRRVERDGRPVWVVKSDRPELVVWGAFGHNDAEYWNSGAGWQRGWMPPMELHKR